MTRQYELRTHNMSLRGRWITDDSACGWTLVSCRYRVVLASSGTFGGRHKQGSETPHGVAETWLWLPNRQVHFDQEDCRNAELTVAELLDVVIDVVLAARAGTAYSLALDM